MTNHRLYLAMTTILSSTLAHAHNSPSVNLDPIIITASKHAQDIKNTPARITVINKQDIDKNPTANLDNILLSDISIYNHSAWGGIGQPSNLSLRGTNSTHTLVLKDGARLNSQNATAPLYPAFIDLSDTDRIEIVKGAASVQHGTDAIGGVVQMRTLTPTDNHSFITGVYGENQTYKAIIGTDLVHDSGAYAQIRGQRLESDGTRIFNSQNEKTQKAGYDQKGYSVKLGYDKERLGASIFVSQNQGINEFSNSGFTPNPQIDATRAFKNRIITARANYDISDNLTVSARYSDVSDYQDVPVYTSHYNTKNKDADAYITWQVSPTQNILAGIAHLDARYDSSAITNQHQSNHSTGYYIQHQFNNDKFNTQMGVRLEDNERYGNHTVGQIAARYHMSPQASIFANVGTAFRAPSLDEIYSSFYVANPNLQPEESLSYEVGADFYINDKTKVYTSAYQTRVDNLIRPVCIAGCTSPNWWEMQNQNTNIDKAVFTGAEVGIKWQAGNVFTSAEYAYINSENRSAGDVNHGKELAYRPKNNFTLSAGYDNGNYGTNVAINARSDAYSNLANTAKLAGYATVDIGAHWHINPHVKIFGNIQNIGNKQYATATYSPDVYYVNGGRQANVGITLSY